MATGTILNQTQPPQSPRRISKSSIALAGMAVVIVVVQRAFLMLSAATAATYDHQTPTLKQLFITGYNHWDSWYYLSISMHGYTDFKESAFLPLYPFVIRIVHMLTGSSYLAVGVWISLICFVIALFFLGQLVEASFDMTTAVVSMLLYAFFPTSYYFDATYTEALFMALLIGTAYFAHRGQLLTAGVLSALATLTRNTGILLCIVLAAELIRARQPGWKFWVLEWWRKTGLSAWSLALAPATFVGYCIWLKYRFGNFLAFVQAEKIWSRTHMEPWNTIAKAFQYDLSSDVHVNTPGYHLFEIMCLLFALGTLALGLLVVGRSLQKWAWWLYATAVVWVFLSAPALGKNPDYLMSVPRFVLMLFPSFIFLARFTRSWSRISLVIAIFACVLFFENAMFYEGLWIA